MSRNKAFTLIELLVVVAIIGILATVVVASVNSAREKARIGAGRHFEEQVEHVAGELLVGKWNFNECSGTTASDSSGYGNNGTLTNMVPTWSTDTPDGSGCSLSFDGSNDFVNLGSSSLLRNISSGSFTISAWMKTSDTSSRGAIIGSYNDAAVPSVNFEIYTTGRMRYYHAGASGSGDDFQGIKSDLRDGKWHQVVMVRDVVNNVGYVYTDGVLDNRDTIDSISGDINSANNIYIGSDNRANADITHNGLIDNVRIFAKSLSASEINDLYAEGLKVHNLAEK